MNRTGIAIGRSNLQAVRDFFKQYPCATNLECSAVLGINTNAIGRHVKTIRSEYVFTPAVRKTPRLEMVETDLRIVVDRCRARPVLPENSNSEDL